jgi:hypothetical protein
VGVVPVHLEPLLDLLAGVAGLLGGDLVGVDGHLAVRRAERAVAEGVVEVLVRVDDRRDVADPEGPDLLHDGPGRTCRRLGVDDDEAGRAPDQADVEVVPLLPGHPDPVGHLAEQRHGGQPRVTGPTGALE